MEQTNLLIFSIYLSNIFLEKPDQTRPKTGFYDSNFHVHSGFLLISESLWTALRTPECVYS